MPKQRNHPHKHRHGRVDGQLELPEARFPSIGGFSRYFYPKGWVTRSSAEGFRRMYLVAFVTVGVILLVAALLALVFGAR